MKILPFTRTFLLFLIFTYSICDAQNFIPNAEFEGHSSCPAVYGDITPLLDWFNPTGGSPDYFHSCGAIGVPVNFGGYQPARSGSAYVGIVCKGGPSAGIDFREYIGVHLSAPMVQGSCYLFKMYVNLINNAMFTTDEIGAYLCDTLVSGIGSQTLLVNAQITNTAGFITDTLGWTLISGTYVATGNENYLILGNFKDDTNTNTLATNYGLFNHAYFFIDDVSLTLIPPCTAGISELDGTPVSAYPNPVTDQLNIVTGNNETYEVTLYDMDSRILMREKFTHDIALYTTQLENGIYLYEVQSKNNVIKKGKVVK